MDGDESEFIKIIEKDLDLRSHYTNPLEYFSIADIESHVFQQDLPVNSTSYYAEWCVSRLVNQSGVKVLLIGQGGDELLAGYHHHFYRYCRSLILHGKIFKYLSEVKSYAEIKSVDVNYLHRTIINEIKLIIKLKTGLQTINDDLEKHWSIASKLIDILKIDFSDAMAFGLETRHPFLDYRLVDFCFSMPDDLKIKNGWQKNILRECMTELPEKIRYRKDKKGYTTPESDWIKKYQAEFDGYLSHIPEQFKKYRSSNTFLNFALGAWFKVNNIS
jgi:asparagine synthase (glutamine-hydrolysing)